MLHRGTKIRLTDTDVSGQIPSPNAFQGVTCTETHTTVSFHQIETTAWQYYTAASARPAATVHLQINSNQHF